MFTMANLQLPPCKVGLSFNLGVETHVLMKLKNSDVSPQTGTLHAGTNNLSPGTLENDRQDLLKVTTKNDSKATKRLVRVPQVPKRAIHSLHDVAVLHGGLIPYDQVSVTDQGSKLGVLGDVAECGLMARDRDLEA